MRRIYNGQAGGEILPVCGYHDQREDRYGLLSGQNIFRLVVPPLQTGVVGPYLVRGTWFSSHLPLEGISRINIFGP
jgi:hypothetical protein